MNRFQEGLYDTGFDPVARKRERAKTAERAWRFIQSQNSETGMSVRDKYNETKWLLMDTHGWNTHQVNEALRTVFKANRQSLRTKARGSR